MKKNKKGKNIKKNKKNESDDEEKYRQNEDNNSDNDNENNNNSDEEEEEIEDLNIKLLKGNYFIFAKTNKKKLVSVPKSSKQPGVQLEIDNFTKGATRQFEIEPIEDGMFRIKSVISGLYWKIKEGFKKDEVVQDELDEESDEFKWIFETKDDDKKCVYIKSAFGGKDSEDFYILIDGYVPKPHAKLVIGPYEPSQKFMLCRKV